PYMLFVERAVNVGGAMKLVPSLSRPVTVTGGSGGAANTTLAPAQERSASAGHRRHHVAAAPSTTSASVAAVPGRLLQASPVAATSAARRDLTWAGAAGVGFALAALAGYRRRRRQLGPLREAA